jgi:hypothetical protein
MSATQSAVDVTTVASGEWRELASRADDGVEKFLLWSKAAARVKVAVADTKLGDVFELDVAAADALPAFYHAFAYVAGRGLRPGHAGREALHLQPQS